MTTGARPQPRQDGQPWLPSHFCNWEAPPEQAPADIHQVFALISAASRRKKNGK